MVLVSAARPAALRDNRSMAEQRQQLRPPPHRGQRREGVAALGLGPEPGGGEGRHRPYELLAPQLQGQQPAERVARDVRPLDAQLLTERAQRRHDRPQVVRDALGQRRGLAEAGQVDGDDVALGGQEVEHRVPRLAVVADAVQQEQRIAGTGPPVGDGDGAAAPGEPIVKETSSAMLLLPVVDGRRRAGGGRHPVSNNYPSVAWSSRGRSRTPCEGRRIEQRGFSFWTAGCRSAGMER